MDELNFHDKPNTIWDMDETNLSTYPTRVKVSGQKGNQVPGLLQGQCIGWSSPPLIRSKELNIWSFWIPSKSEIAPKNEVWLDHQWYF